MVVFLSLGRLDIGFRFWLLVCLEFSFLFFYIVLYIVLLVLLVMFSVCVVRKVCWNIGKFFCGMNDIGR